MAVVTAGSRATAANFGVIDAQGGAAIFESSASTFRKFDANDPPVAPRGYVVRSNFSFTGTPDVDPADETRLAEIYSGGRFLRGCKLVEMALADGGMSVSYLLQHNSRDYSDPSGNPYPGSVNGDPGTLPERIDTTHTISRKTTVSAAVFHGVKPNEDPLLTTMWVMLGEPSFTVAVPCWVGTGDVADEMLGEKTSPICDVARSLRDAFYVEVANDEGETELMLKRRRCRRFGPARCPPNGGTSNGPPPRSTDGGRPASNPTKRGGSTVSSAWKFTPN